MIRNVACLAALLAAAILPTADAAVTMSFGPSAPTTGPNDQFNFQDDATIPGGTAPGGGTYNSMAYSDNAGPPGQTFTTPATSFAYEMRSFSLKGASTGTPNFGAAVFAAGTTWGIRISAVSGTSLTPIKTFTGIPTVVNTGLPENLDGDEWYKWTFTDADIPLLDASKVYAFDLFSSASYLGFDAAQTDAAYAAGAAFNSAGPARSFANTTLGNLATHGYDHTFHVQLVSPPIIKGDANGDSVVNIADYNLIRDNLEKSVAKWTNGDVNGDSFVNLNDFRQWTQAAPPELVASIGVPEPSAAALGAMAAAAILRLRRRQSQRDAAKKKLTLLPAFGFLACLGPATVSAQSLGLNFAATDPDAATSTLNATDVAGVVPAASWNNLTGPSGANVGGLVYNSAGTATPSAATVSWFGPNTFRSGGNNAFPEGPNRVLMSGYLDTGNTAATALSITVNNIDAALRSPSYDVYVYLMSDSTANRGGGYTLNDGSGPTVKYGSTMAAPTSFVEDPGTDANNSMDGTYLRFQGLTGVSFTLTGDATLTTPNGNRAPVSAIQIVGGQPVGLKPADVNLDGFINLADYQIIKSNFFLATGATRAMGDITLDGRVDLADFVLWKNNVPASVAASAVVPEPSGFAIAVSGVVLAIRSRGRVIA